MQNLKGNDHLISHTILSGHLVPKKRDMLPRKKPWLVSNWHNIFLKHHINKSRICRDFNTYNENNVSYFEVNIN